jgi:hypothetical protein
MFSYKYITIIFVLIIIYFLYKRKEGFNSDNTLHIFNQYHLGDCVFMMIYLQHIKDFIINTGRRIKFYINKNYIDQIREFIPNENVTLHPLEEKPAQVHDVWIAHSFHFLDNQKNFLPFMTKHSNRLADEIFKAPKMETFVYTDADLDTRYSRLDPAKYHDVDFLIINSKPQSGQLEYDEAAWNSIVEDLGRLYKVVTTLKVGNIPCTLDDKLSIKDIAAISTRAKNIIAINTGPLIGCFNSAALKNVQKWYIFDTHYNFLEPTFKSVLDFKEIRETFL